MVSFQRNVAKEALRTRSSIEIWDWRNDTPNATGCTRTLRKKEDIYVPARRQKENIYIPNARTWRQKEYIYVYIYIHVYICYTIVYIISPPLHLPATLSPHTPQTTPQKSWRTIHTSRHTYEWVMCETTNVWDNSFVRHFLQKSPISPSKKPYPTKEPHTQLQGGEDP